MTIQQIKIADIRCYAKNAKKHESSQIDKIEESIREFGFNNPILVDSELQIIAGHGRFAAAKQMGLDSVPCVILSHLTDRQKRAYILADNRLGEIGGGWDLDTLKLELDELSALNVDLDEIGFGDFDFGDEEEKKKDEPINILLQPESIPETIINSRDGSFRARADEWENDGAENLGDEVCLFEALATRFAPPSMPILQINPLDFSAGWFCKRTGRDLYSASIDQNSIDYFTEKLQQTIGCGSVNYLRGDTITNCADGLPECGFLFSNNQTNQQFLAATVNLKAGSYFAIICSCPEEITRTIRQISDARCRYIGDIVFINKYDESRNAKPFGFPKVAHKTILIGRKG